MEQSLAERIVIEARSWMHPPTKWMHQGRIKGLGVDCAGFIVGVAVAARTGVDVTDSEKIRTVAYDLGIPNNYKRRENGELLLDLLDTHMTLVPNEEISPGDVLALIEESLRDPDVPRHLVIVTQVLPISMIIHASARGVVEHRLSPIFAKRIHSCWRVKE